MGKRLVNGDARALHFAFWMCAEGVVNAEDALLAMKYCDRRTPRFAQLALKERLLSVEQVFRVLKHQTVSDELFGEICVAFGYLTYEEVARLLKLQRQSAPAVIEVLVELMHYDAAALQSAHERFEEYLRQGRVLETAR